MYFDRRQCSETSGSSYLQAAPTYYQVAGDWEAEPVFYAFALCGNYTITGT
jgi:hypothetical protein